MHNKYKMRYFLPFNLHIKPSPRWGRVLACAIIYCASEGVGLCQPVSGVGLCQSRLSLDFNKTHDEVKAYIQRYIPDVTDAQMEHWEQTKALETHYINGQKWYFHNAGPNLFRIDPQCRAIKRQKDGEQKSASMEDERTDIPAIMKDAPKSPYRLGPAHRMRVTYTLTVHPDAVPTGETLRCWLPFPRNDIRRQTGVRLLSTSEDHYIQSPSAYDHSTIYMERKAEAGKPTVFSETFEFTTHGAWFGITPDMVKPYDTTTARYRKYTANRREHIIVTPRIQHLADSLTRGITNPLLQARALYTYVDEHFPWASAREYSTIPNIPEYVLDNGHGDCGQVTLLFLTLCRAKGIPGHFESGFMVHPHEQNLHDWAEIYFEGVGWVPVDQSFGRVPWAKDDATRYFYLGGIDSYRLVVNSDYGMPLYPAKRYPRSETVDFQRGEVEWQGGNLYFNQWSWNIKVEYL